MHEASVKESLTKGSKTLKQKVLDNVQVIISFSCEDSILQRRLKSNPELLRVCDLQTFTSWTESTASEIIRHHLRKLCLNKKEDEEFFDQIKDSLLKIHSTAGVDSSRKLLSFVKLFIQIYQNKSTEIQSRSQFLIVQTTLINLCLMNTPEWTLQITRS